jgi:translation elongation factor EF-1alpha
MRSLTLYWDCKTTVSDLEINRMIGWQINQINFIPIMGPRGANRNCTYFTFKEHFIREKYTFLNDFKVRQAICKIRISAHPLMSWLKLVDIKTWKPKNDYVNCA